MNRTRTASIDTRSQLGIHRGRLTMQTRAAAVALLALLRRARGSQQTIRRTTRLQSALHTVGGKRSSMARAFNGVTP